MTRGDLLRIDVGDPLNRSAPLAEGLVNLWLPIPQLGGGTTIPNLASPHPATGGDGTAWTADTDWQFPVVENPSSSYSFTREAGESPVTAAVWMSRIDESSVHVGLSKGSYTSPNTRNYFLGADSSDNILVQFSNSGGSDFIRSGSFPSGEFRLISASLKAGDQKAYEDGVLAGTESRSFAPSTDATDGFLGSTDGIFRFAAVWSGVRPTRWHQYLNNQARLGFPKLVNKRPALY